MSEKVDKAKAEIDRDLWMTAPQTVNAYYMPTDNSINIPAGILGGDFYDSNGTIEQQMGSIGVIIGHEITHGFDSNTGSLTTGRKPFPTGGRTRRPRGGSRHTDKGGRVLCSIEFCPEKYINEDYTIIQRRWPTSAEYPMLELAKKIDGFGLQTFLKAGRRFGKCRSRKRLRNICCRPTRTRRVIFAQNVNDAAV